MADQFAVVEFTSPATATNLEITSPSITEPFSAAILIFTRETTDSADNEHAIVGIGFIAPNAGFSPTTEEHAYCIRADGSAAGTTPDTSTDHDLLDRAINAMEGPTGTTAIAAAYSASISGGVRLNFTTVLDPGAGPIRTKCTAILFAGLARAYTDGCSSTTLGVSEPVGGSTTFEPHLVIFTSAASALNAPQNDAAPNIGFACNTSPIQQVANFQRWDDGTEPSDSDSYLRNDAAYATFPTTAEQYSSITAFTATGFNHTANASSPSAHYLALQFTDPDIRFFCGHASVSGTTGRQTFTSAEMDFVPDLVVGMSSLMTSQNTLVDGALASACGFFVTGRYGSRAYTVHAQEGQSGTGFNCHTRQEDVGLLTYNHLGAIAQRATWDTAGATGFALDFTTATAGTITFLAIGGGSLESIVNETERISDGHFLNLISYRVINETVQISDGLGGLILADGLTALQDTGSVFQGGAVKGEVFQGGAVSGVVEG